MSPKRRPVKQHTAPQLRPFDPHKQLENAVQLVAKQDQITWAIFAVFWPANALLLVALFTTGNLPSREIGIIVSAVGFVLSLAWTLIQSRSIAHLKFYESLIQNIESKYIDIPIDASISGRTNEVLFDAAMAGTIGVRSLMKVIGVLSAFLWFISFIMFFVCKTA